MELKTNCWGYDYLHSNAIPILEYKFNYRAYNHLSVVAVHLMGNQGWKRLTRREYLNWHKVNIDLEDDPTEIAPVV